MLCWLSLDASSSTFVCPWLSYSLSSWHFHAHDVLFQIHISSQVKFLPQFHFCTIHCRSFLTKKLETVPSTSFIQRISLPYWTNSIHRSIFPLSKTLTIHFFRWFILIHLERSKNNIFIISLCFSNVWILIRSFILAFTDAPTASVDSTLQYILLKAVDHHKSPYLWCEVCDTFAHSPADFNVPISVLIDFPFLCLIQLQIYWAIWLYIYIRLTIFM